MMDFLLFRSFVSHTLIKIFFYLGLGGLILAYIGTIIFALVTQGIEQGAIYAFFGIFMLAMYAILLRVSCEMMIIIFQIHDELKTLNAKR